MLGSYDTNVSIVLDIMKSSVKVEDKLRLSQVLCNLETAKKIRKETDNIQ
jgi:hypothetical protein